MKLKNKKSFLLGCVFLILLLSITAISSVAAADSLNDTQVVCNNISANIEIHNTYVMEFNNNIVISNRTFSYLNINNSTVDNLRTKDLNTSTVKNSSAVRDDIKVLVGSALTGGCIGGGYGAEWAIKAIKALDKAEHALVSQAASPRASILFVAEDGVESSLGLNAPSYHTPKLYTCAAGTAGMAAGLAGGIAGAIAGKYAGKYATDFVLTNNRTSSICEKHERLAGGVIGGIVGSLAGAGAGATVGAIVGAGIGLFLLAPVPGATLACAWVGAKAGVLGGSLSGFMSGLIEGVFTGDKIANQRGHLI